MKTLDISPSRRAGKEPGIRAPTHLRRITNVPRESQVVAWHEYGNCRFLNANDAARLLRCPKERIIPCKPGVPPNDTHEWTGRMTGEKAGTARAGYPQLWASKSLLVRWIRPRRQRQTLQLPQNGRRPQETCPWRELLTFICSRSHGES